MMAFISTIESLETRLGLRRPRKQTIKEMKQFLLDALSRPDSGEEQGQERQNDSTRYRIDCSQT